MILSLPSASTTSTLAFTLVSVSESSILRSPGRIPIIISSPFPIFFSSNCESASFERAMLCPFAKVILPGLSLPYISADHENMVRLAANHLLEAGHKYILYFNANVKTNSSLSMRKESFINTLYNAHNYRPYFYSFEGDADPTSLSFCDDFREFLDANTKISAIITADYASGLHLSKILSTLGSPYEQRFEIVYLDFNPMQFEALIPENRPTYIMQDSYQIGADAIKLMQSALNGTDISNTKIIVPSSIVVGNNSKQPPLIFQQLNVYPK